MPLLRDILQFKYSWRKYQSSVLDSLSAHLADKRVNVVAAPGAGKTTLGIEIIARLNKPALILVPTITIRNQWKSRIAEAFLKEGFSIDSIVSFSISSPREITISTYQALLAAFCGIEEDHNDTAENDDDVAIEENDTGKRSAIKKHKVDALLRVLRSAGIEVLCLDEAHHLRNEWWKALNLLNEKLSPKIISLTATPPFDVEYEEWKRYESLCGSIDASISIPELVQNGDLCPHQDFIYFSRLRESEKTVARNYELALESFVKRILSYREFADALSRAKIFADAQSNTERILDCPDFFVSLLGYLKIFGIKPRTKLYEIVGVKYSGLRSFGFLDINPFLDGLIFYNRELFEESEPYIAELENEARKAGLISAKKFSLCENAKIKKLFALSLGKLDAIEEIVSAESNSRGESLRMLILADYIRASALNSDIGQFGVVPIFETLRKRCNTNIKLGVLTGSVVLIPKECIPILEDSPTLSGKINFDALEPDGKYVRVKLVGDAKRKIVTEITSLFRDGKINVLIGTQALLGEGWDAPSINSLVLSSTVKSYMLSNQMRGRAIRIDKNNPRKVATIWHLCSIKFLNLYEQIKTMLPKTSVNDSELLEADDFICELAALAKRFEGFEAPSSDKPSVIRSGISRILNVQKVLSKRAIPSYWNKNSLAACADLSAIEKSWEDALKDPYDNPELKLTSELALDKIKNSFWSFANLTYILMFNSVIALIVYGNGLQRCGIYGAIAAFSLFSFLSFRPTLMWIRCGNPNRYMRQIARTVIETLSAMDIVKTRLDSIAIKSETIGEATYLRVANLPQDETNIVINAIREIMDPIENPRYIIVRQRNWHNILQTDYHAVPSVVSSKRENVEIFKDLWYKYVSDCKVFYTRNIEGRKLLLKAKNCAYSSAVRKKKSILTNILK